MSEVIKGKAYDLAARLVASLPAKRVSSEVMRDLCKQVSASAGISADTAEGLLRLHGVSCDGDAEGAPTGSVRYGAFYSRVPRSTRFRDAWLAG